MQKWTFMQKCPLLLSDAFTKQLQCKSVPSCKSFTLCKSVPSCKSDSHPLFTDSKNWFILQVQKYFLIFSQSKSEATIGSLWKAQTKTAKKDYFTKHLSTCRFFEICTSNFNELFLVTFRKLCLYKIEKIKKLINFIKQTNKKYFLFVFLYKFLFFNILNFVLTEFFKYWKEQFPKSLR